MLKELLGDLYTPEIATKIGDKKFAVVNDGSWIPRDKFNQETQSLKDQLKERDTQLTDLQKAASGNAELQAKIQTLTETNKQVQADYDAKLKQLAFDTALDKALVVAKAKNVKAVRANLDLSKVQLNGETLSGLDEQLKTLQTNDGYLFGEAAPIGSGTNTGDKGAGGGGEENPNKAMNAFIRGSVGIQA